MRRILLVLTSALLLLLGACGEGDTPVFVPQGTPDTMSPYINMRQYEFYTEVNNPIDFSNIGGYDDVDGLLPTRLRGYVDYTTPGDYYPRIVCTDLSNNESEVIITIHVLESGSLETPVPDQPTPEPTPSICTSPEAQDPHQPCQVVLGSVLKQYRTIYEGEEGLDLCTEKEGEDACEVILRNDGSFWGYGAK